MKSYKNVFDTDDYQPDYNIRKLALEQYSEYLSHILKKNKKEIYANLSRYIKAHPEKYASVKAKILIKNEYGDRIEKEKELGSVLAHVKKKNYILSPSLIAYKNSAEEECLNSIATKKFTANRNNFKKERKKAQVSGDTELEKKADVLQNAFKIFNNSQSGAFSVGGTPIHCPSAHTTLTSTCRCVVSIANILNEHIIIGNRFYRTPDYVIQSMISRIQETDFEALDQVMKKYKLVYPSHDDLMEIIHENSKYYWQNDEDMALIKEFVFALPLASVAGIVYILDLMSLYRHNKTFMDHFFTEWITVPACPEGNMPFIDEALHTLALAKIGDYDENKINQLNHYHVQLEEKYHDFISIFFKTKSLFPGLYNVVDQVRLVGQISDTDSSVVTVNPLIQCYSGKDDNINIKMTAVVTYFITRILKDKNRQLSINMNVEKKNQNMLDMKNEYYFSGLVTTSMNKHYYALIRMTEGAIHKDPRTLKKGVHLRSSKISAKIKDKANDIMRKLLDATERGEQIDGEKLLCSIGDQEREVISELQEGQWVWLSTESIKVKSAYKDPMVSSYYHYELWNDVFADKYGKAPEPPYLGVKASVLLHNASSIAAWGEMIEDKALFDRFIHFMKTKKAKSKGISNFLIPIECLNSLGKVPDEIIQVLDLRDIIKQNFKCIYATLEGAGLPLLDDKARRLISDEY